MGKTVGPFEFEAQASRIGAFAEAVGASASDNGTPPTFLTVCRQGEFGLLTEMGIRLSQVLHGEQEYLSPEAILPGDQLNYTTSLAHLIEKKIGTFLIFETVVSARRSTGKIEVGTARTTIVVRA